jgi:hypothetical protein
MPALNIPRREGLPELESDVLSVCRKWLAEQPDISVHRNKVGSASMTVDDFTRAGLGYEESKTASNVVQNRFRGMRFGLAVGSSDLIGSLTVECYRFDVGPNFLPGKHRIARALAIALKQPGKRPTKDQERFLSAKRAIGWVAFWADDLETVQDMIGRARRWEI